MGKVIAKGIVKRKKDFCIMLTQKEMSVKQKWQEAEERKKDRGNRLNLLLFYVFYF